MTENQAWNSYEDYLDDIFRELDKLDSGEKIKQELSTNNSNFKNLKSWIKDNFKKGTSPTKIAQHARDVWFGVSEIVNEGTGKEFDKIELWMDNNWDIDDEYLIKKAQQKFGISKDQAVEHYATVAIQKDAKRSMRDNKQIIKDFPKLKIGKAPGSNQHIGFTSANPKNKNEEGEALAYWKKQIPEPWNMEKEWYHETHRIETMSPQALQTRINKITDPKKMYFYAMALDNIGMIGIQNINYRTRECYKSIAKMAFDKLEDMDVTAKNLKENKDKEMKTKEILRPLVKEWMGGFGIPNFNSICDKCDMPANACKCQTDEDLKKNQKAKLPKGLKFQQQQLKESVEDIADIYATAINSYFKKKRLETDSNSVYARYRAKGYNDEAAKLMILKNIPNGLKDAGIPDRGLFDEVAPAGWSGTVLAMKKHKNITNPYALAYWQKKHGAKPHYKDKKKEEGCSSGPSVLKKQYKGKQEEIKLGEIIKKIDRKKK